MVAYLRAMFLATASLAWLLGFIAIMASGDPCEKGTCDYNGILLPANDLSPTTKETFRVFLEWFTKKGGKIHPGLKIVEYSNEFRDVQATQLLKEGTELAVIPRATMITVPSLLKTDFGT